MVSISALWKNAFEGVDRTVGLESSKSSLKFQESETSANKNEEERLECPICFEPFDVSKNTPHVLVCGHTLCKNCVLGLQRAVWKFQKLQPIALPFFVSCPWCNGLSPRLVYNGNLNYPSKNFFVLWMVDGKKGDLTKKDDHPVSCSPSNSVSCTHHYDQNEGYTLFTLLNLKNLLLSLQKLISCFAQTNPTFLIAVVFLFVVLCTISASTTILFMYVLATLCVWSALVYFPELYFPEMVSFC